MAIRGIRALYHSSRPDYYNILEFGAIPNAFQVSGPPHHYVGGTDNAPAINEAIGNAKASSYRKGVYIPPPVNLANGGGFAAGAINMKDFHSGRFFGHSTGMSRLLPLEAAIGSSNVFINISGSGGFVMENLTVGTKGFNPAATLFALIYYAQSSFGGAIPGTYAATGNASLFHRIDLYGFTQAGGATFQWGAGTAGDAGAPSCVISNSFIRTYGSIGSVAVPAAKGSAALKFMHTTGVTIENTEIHDNAAEQLWQIEYPNDPATYGDFRYLAPSTAFGIHFHNCNDISFKGSNATIGGNGIGAIRLSGSNRNIRVQEAEAYAQEPVGSSPTHPKPAWDYIFYNESVVEDLTAQSIRNDFRVAVFGGENATTYHQVDHIGRENYVPTGAPYIAKVVSGNMTFTESRLMCAGMAFDIGSGGNGKNTELHNVGAITMAGITSGNRKGALVKSKANGTWEFQSGIAATRHAGVAGPAPTVGSLSGWGTSPTINSIVGDMTAGVIDITSGSAPSGSASFTITYPTTDATYTTAPILHLWQTSLPTAPGANPVRMRYSYNTGSCSVTFDLDGNNWAPPAATNFKFAYHILGGRLTA